MKYKHCVNIYVNKCQEYTKLFDEFIKHNNTKYIFCEKQDRADIVIGPESVTGNKINIVVSADNMPILRSDQCYVFQPFLYDKTGDINEMADELGVFTETVVNDFKLPYKVDSTILIVC